LDFNTELVGALCRCRIAPRVTMAMRAVLKAAPGYRAVGRERLSFSERSRWARS